MNDTLKGVAHIGAELAAAKADLQREMERHRKTWRQLEQSRLENETLKKLLKHARKKSALSQLAEPAPAQDEREFNTSDDDLTKLLNIAADLVKGNGGMDLGVWFAQVLERVETRLTRPAQTAPQPEQSGLVGRVCGGDAQHNTVNVALTNPAPWEELRIGTAVSLSLAAQGGEA